MTKKMQQPEALPLDPEEESEVLAWLKSLPPDEQRKLLEMARINDTPSGKFRRTFNAGRGRGGIF